ncbi:hypothetical protein [Tenacibaculum xiamenense]|uniref:hypothetical protein n=1 Tax=Tenacibaculum xiamenense TaxID=1261553 RepID=UPI0038968189
MKPYKRILRPSNVNSDNFGHFHLVDDRNCVERFQLVHAYHIIESDFKKLFDYVELNDSNKSTFSHRIYELILRTCTEFETNCTGILDDNGYTKSGNLNITDYFKINEASKLNEYEVRLNVWSPNPLTIKPFMDWNSTSFTSLSWYQNYNSAKHNRNANFHLASLENLVNCMAGLYAVLASQFAHHIFSPYQITEFYSRDDDGFISVDSSVFSIKIPSNWNTSDEIIFDWNTLKNDTAPFDNYTF